MNDWLSLLIPPSPSLPSSRTRLCRITFFFEVRGKMRKERRMACLQATSELTSPSGPLPERRTVTRTVAALNLFSSNCLFTMSPVYHMGWQKSRLVSFQVVWLPLCDHSLPLPMPWGIYKFIHSHIALVKQINSFGSACSMGCWSIQWQLSIWQLLGQTRSTGNLMESQKECIFRFENDWCRCKFSKARRKSMQSGMTGGEMHLYCTASESIKCQVPWTELNR